MLQMQSILKDRDPEKDSRLKGEGRKKYGKRCEGWFLGTPPKINIEPEHDGLEDDFPFPGVYSQVPC